MEHMNLEPAQRGRGFTLFLVFAVIALIAAAVAIWFSIGSTMDKLTDQAEQRTKNNTVVVNTPTPQQITPVAAGGGATRAGGTMRLQSLDGAVGQVGKPIQLAVFADSNGKDVVGFDIVLDYDSRGFDFSGATANASSFNVATSTQKNVIAVSGYKSIGEKSPTVFTNTQIATVTIVPKQTGSLTVQPVASAGTSKSKMVTSAKEVLLPSLDPVTIIISN